MGDKLAHLAGVAALHEQLFGTAEEHRLAKMLAEESVRARVDMAWRFANLHMPSDIRGRARAWGMETWAEVLWNNAFQAGWRECLRAREEEQKRAEKEAGNG